MSNAQLETAIEAAWEARDTITPSTTGETREAIEDTLNANLTLALGEYGGAGDDVQIDIGGGTTVTTCSLDANDVDADGCGTAGSTITIAPTAGLTVGTIATENPAVISFRVTIN